MKKSTISESLASTFMLAGALAIGYVLFPILNPIQFKLMILGQSLREQEPIPVTYIFFHCLIGVPVAYVILRIAFYFNREASRLKGEELNFPRSDIN